MNRKTHRIQGTRLTTRGFLQLVVLRTSSWPLKHLYGIVYAVCVVIVAGLLQHIRGVRTIYLRRGLSSGEAVYGLSDIDLSIVIDDSDPSDEHIARQRILSAYALLALFIPFLGDASRECGIYTHSEFISLYTTHPFFAYRFHQGKQTWRLLFGKDLRAELTPLPIPQIQESTTEEARTWWLYLAQSLFSDQVAPVFKRTYLWYKALADLSKAALLIHEGKVPTSRKSAVRLIQGYLEPPQQQAAAYIENQFKRLPSVRKLHENQLLELFFQLAGSIFEYSETTLRTRIKKETFLLRHQTGTGTDLEIPSFRQAQMLGKNVDAKLSPYLKGVMLFPRTYLGADPLDISDIDTWHVILIPRTIIPYAQLREVALLMKEAGDTSPPIEVLIKNGPCALSLRPSDGKTAIRDRRSDPILFSFLTNCKETSRCLSGKDRYIETVLPPSVADKTNLRASRLSALLQDPDIYKMAPLSFSRFFFTALRTKLMSRHLINGTIYVPVTSKQILKQANDLLPESANWLSQFRQEYLRELNNEKSSVFAFYQSAITFLQSIPSVTTHSGSTS